MLSLPEASGLSTADIGSWVMALASLTRTTDDAERVDRIRILEEVKAAAAAAQARETAAFRASQVALQEAAGVPSRERGRGVGAQVALARRESPMKGGRFVGLAEALVHEMPQTLAAMELGTLSEWRATLVVRETACLSREDRMTTDAELAGWLHAMGDREVAEETRRIAYRLDPYAVTERARKAASERRVSLRPAPDAMSYLTGLLPVQSGVAAHAALAVHADALRAAGDRRSRGQIMADTLVERLTGRAVDAPSPTWADRIAETTWESCRSVPAPADSADGHCSAQHEHEHEHERADADTAQHRTVELQVVMSDQALFGIGPGAEDPAWVTGYGPVPAPLARLFLAGACGGDDGPDGPDGPDGAAVDPAAQVWVRRLYTDPDDGHLVAMDSSRRLFPRGLARFIATRDRRCRTPWCSAPIRHTDHVLPHQLGGDTSADNGQGLCEACNYAKQATGWVVRPGPEGAGSQVLTTTPTGHSYTSSPPRPPGGPPTATVLPWSTAPPRAPAA